MVGGEEKVAGLAEAWVDGYEQLDKYCIGMGDRIIFTEEHFGSAKFYLLYKAKSFLEFIGDECFGEFLYGSNIVCIRSCSFWVDIESVTGRFKDKLKVIKRNLEIPLWGKGQYTSGNR